MILERRGDRRVSADQEPTAFALDDPSGVAAPRIAPDARAPVLDLDRADEHVAARRRDRGGLVPAKLPDRRIAASRQEIGDVRLP